MKRTPRFRSSVPAFRAALALAGAVAVAAVLAPRADAGPPCAGPAREVPGLERCGFGLEGCGLEGGWRLEWHPAWPGCPLASAGYRNALEGNVFPGLWIALDPVTRRPVRPTPEQRASAALQAPAIDEVLPVQRIPGGGELIHLNGRHMVFEVARRDASGRFTTGCASDSAAAARLVATPVSSSPRVAK